MAFCQSIKVPFIQPENESDVKNQINEVEELKSLLNFAVVPLPEEKQRQDSDEVRKEQKDHEEVLRPHHNHLLQLDSLQQHYSLAHYLKLSNRGNQEHVLELIGQNTH